MMRILTTNGEALNEVNLIKLTDAIFFCGGKSCFEKGGINHKMYLILELPTKIKVRLIIQDKDTTKIEIVAKMSRKCKVIKNDE